MTPRHLAIICHNALRPVYKSHHDNRAVKWGDTTPEYKAELCVLVAARLTTIHEVITPEAPLDRVIQDIVETIVTNNPHELESTP